MGLKQLKSVAAAVGVCALLASCAKPAKIETVKDATFTAEITTLFVVEHTDYLTVQRDNFHRQLVRSFAECGIEVQSDYTEGTHMTYDGTGIPASTINLALDQQLLQSFHPSAVLTIAGTSLMTKGRGAKDAKFDISLLDAVSHKNIWKAQVDFDFGDVPILANGSGWAADLVARIKNDGIIRSCHPK